MKINGIDIFFIGVIFLILITTGFAVVDASYKLPQAANSTNEICQEKGYDFYENFERIGILSKEPVAIKCKYVDNYKQIDMNLRQTEDYVVIQE